MSADDKELAGSMKYASHPIRDNIGEWIGKEVDVMLTQDDWKHATLLGLDNNMFLARVNGESLRFFPYCRPPQPKRRVPTDKDALKRPRCWVRERDDAEWKPAILYGVHARQSSFVWAAYCDDGCAGFYRFCVIEDKP